MNRTQPHFVLLKKSATPPEFTDTVIQLDDDASNFSRIRCPLCGWQPNASSRWACAGRGGPPEYFSQGCGTVWNTFTTRGLCPGCGHQWRWTACLRCHNFSLHEDWYAKEID
ncbi:MAG: hypothetical protein U0401_32830 [Anaerolineae bacterium]